MTYKAITGACALALAAVVASGAGAALLQVSDGLLIGATGVEIEGSIYDVEFLDGSCAALFDGCDEDSDFTFTADSSAEAAATALLDHVFVGGFDADPGLTAG